MERYNLLKHLSKFFDPKVWREAKIWTWSNVSLNELKKNFETKESHTTQASNIPVEWERDVADDLI